jgi:hypothetical protein
MSLIVADRVQETTNSTGTGAYTLGGAVPGFQTFASEVSNADTVYYSVTDNVDFEVGLGTYASSGNLISRTTVFSSSNSNNAVSWGVGTKNIFLTYPADKAVIEDVSNNVTIGNNLVVGGTVDGVDIQTLNTTANAALPKAGGTMTGDLVLNADPTAALQSATKQYVDTIAAAGIHYHQACRAETTANLNATYSNGSSGVGATLTNAGTQAALVLDGVTLVATDRVMVQDQTNTAHNGVYTVTTVGSGSTNWVLTRATDADSYSPSDPDALGEGDAFFITEGTVHGGELDVMTTSGVITFGTTGIVFAQVSDAPIYTAGAGLSISGTEFSLVTPVTSATALATARTIGMTGDVVWTSATFDGTGNVTGVATIQPNSVALGTDTTGSYVGAGATSGTGLSGSLSGEGGTFTVTSNATNANTASTIVARDGSGNFSAGTITGALSGNATTATSLASGRTIGMTGDVVWTSASFDGSGNVTGTATIQANSVALGTDTTGNYVSSIANGSYLTGGGSASENKAYTLGVDATSANTASKVVARDSSGNFSAGTVTAALTGNAATATALQNARAINGVSFNGTANITVADSNKLPLAGGTLTGQTNFNDEVRINNGNGTQTHFNYNDNSSNYIRGTSLAVDCDATFTTGAGAITLSNSDIRSADSNPTWTGNPGTVGKIQYHSNRWYVVSDSNSTNICTFRRDSADASYIDNSGNLVGGNADAWNNYRTLSLTGDVTGSVSWNGSANASISASLSAPYSYIDTATGNYGTVKVDDDRGVTWAGYAIRDDWVFMSNGAAQCGIYDDTQNEWAIECFTNAQVNLYYNGVQALQTIGNGIRVGNTTASDIYMADIDEGERRIHCNSNRIGFLNSSSGWSAYSEDGGLWYCASGLTVVGASTFNDNVQISAGDTLVVGGTLGNNGYNSVSSSTIYLGGGNDRNNYSIGTLMENYGGNYTKLDLRWHTGIRMFAVPQYGGMRYFTDNAMSTEIFSIGKGDQHVRVANDLFVGNSIIHEGDTDTNIWFGTNEMVLTTGGSSEVTINTTGVRLGDTGNGYFQPVTGNYGSIQIDGGAHGGWEGYSIGGRVVFMHDNSNTSGIYNDVDNEWYFRGDRNSYTRMYHNGSTKVETSSSGVTITGDLNSTSDIRYKKNIEAIDGALDKVKSLKGVTFDWDNDAFTADESTKKPNFTARATGVIAQDVEKVLPEAVCENEDGMKNVAYGNMVGLLIEAIKEQQAQIDELKAQLNG